MIDPSLLRLYLLVDADAALPDLVDRAAAACGPDGATLVQMRSKTLDARHQVDLTRELVSRLPCPVLVNDRVDVAHAAGAAGVHLGQSDIHPEDAHAILGHHGIVGLTLHTENHARSAPLSALEYVSIGGVFATRTKTDPVEPIGVEGLKSLAAIVRDRDAAMPLCAIAGISADNAPSVMAAGLDGVCVSSAILTADDPGEAARAVRRAVEAAHPGGAS